jgi:hypothetical protein
MDLLRLAGVLIPSALPRLLPRKGLSTMAKDGNTVAKRQRETEQKRKAEEKRARRQRKKSRAEYSLATPPTEPPGVESAET